MFKPVLSMVLSIVSFPNDLDLSRNAKDPLIERWWNCGLECVIKRWSTFAELYYSTSEDLTHSTLVYCGAQLVRTIRQSRCCTLPVRSCTTLFL